METAETDLLRRRVISPAEYGRISGLSEATVRRACERKEIPAIRIGRRWLIPADELDSRLAKAAAESSTGGE